MISLIFLLASTISKDFNEINSIEGIRILYQKSAAEEQSCEKLLSILQFYNENNNTLLAGYKACATMMKANYGINPIIKLSNFSAGKRLLESCIKADNENIELRYLRFTIQHNAPTFLNYRNSIQEDKLFLMNSISKLKDLKLKELVLSFLKDSNFLTKEEKKNLIS